MPESTPLSDQPDAMQVERRIATLPVRAADATWQVVSEFLVSLMQQRERETDTLQSSLSTLQPLATYLLVMHKLQFGWIEFSCGDLQFTFRFDYGGTPGDEDLSLPPLSVLGPCNAETLLTLAFTIDGTLEDSHMLDLIQSVNADGVLRVSVSPEPMADVDPPADVEIVALVDPSCDQDGSPEGGNDACND